MKVAQSCLTLWDPVNPIVHEIPQAKILEWVAFPSPGDLPTPGMEPRSPTLQADSLPAEPPGKPNNTGVGSLSLLRGIFPTQGSSPGLPHCRRILYQLSHQERPLIYIKICKSLGEKFSQAGPSRDGPVPGGDAERILFLPAPPQQQPSGPATSPGLVCPSSLTSRAFCLHPQTAQVPGAHTHSLPVRL